MKLIRWTRRYRRHQQRYSQPDSNMIMLDTVIMAGKLLLFILGLLLTLYIILQI